MGHTGTSIFKNIGAMWFISFLYLKILKYGFLSKSLSHWDIYLVEFLALSSLVFIFLTVNFNSVLGKHRTDRSSSLSCFSFSHHCFLKTIPTLLYRSMTFFNSAKVFCAPPLVPAVDYFSELDSVYIFRIFLSFFVLYHFKI